MPEWLDLIAGDWSAAICPELGGSVMRLRRRGEDVFRPAQRAASSVLDAGCFPLIPYCNRLAFGRVRFGQQSFRIPPNFGEHPHPLHGMGWQSHWHCEDRAATWASLSLKHDGDDRWPFAFRAKQHIELNEQGIRIQLSVENCSREEMPAGLGFHPYFQRRPTSILAFRARRMWLADETLLPTYAVSAEHLAPWSDGAPLAIPILVDNAFDGWTGEAVLKDDRHELHIVAERPGWLHLLVVPDEDYVCIEPVTHGPDAISRGWPMDVLAPGDHLSFAMTIQSAQEAGR